MKKIITAAFAAIVLALSAVPAFAWDGTISGTVGRTDSGTIASQGLMVFMSTPVTMCAGTSNTWAYINTTDTNYATVVTQIALAKTLGSSVIIYTTTVSGNCLIGYVAVN